MKILLDMNLSLAWLPLLSEAGHEAVHWSSCGAVDASDAHIMQFAKHSGFVILTHDLDFGTLLASNPDTAPSVIQLRSANLSPSQVGDIVLRTLVLARADLERGAIVTIDAARTRLRILPVNGPDMIS